MITAREWPPEAETVIVDPETGYPVLHESMDIDHVPGCRGWCDQGRQPCKTPHACHTGRTLHRVIEVLSHPTDEVLRSGTLDEIAEDRRQEGLGLVFLLGVSFGLVALFIICICGPQVAGHLLEALP
jgi:hypothetical protein